MRKGVVPVTPFAGRPWRATSHQARCNARSLRTSNADSLHEIVSYTPWWLCAYGKIYPQRNEARGYAVFRYYYPRVNSPISHLSLEISCCGLQQILMIAFLECPFGHIAHMLHQVLPTAFANTAPVNGHVILVLQSAILHTPCLLDHPSGKGRNNPRGTAKARQSVGIPVIDHHRHAT